MKKLVDNKKTVKEIVKELNKEKYYMSGEEFRFIIRNWGLSHSQIAKAAGYNSPSIVSYWKTKKYVSKEKARIIEEIIGTENFEIMRQLYQRNFAKQQNKSAIIR